MRQRIFQCICSFGFQVECDEVGMAFWSHVCIIVVVMQDPPLSADPPPLWANLPLAQHNIATWQYHVVTWRLGALGPYADQAYLLTPEDFSIHLQFEGFLRWGLQWWQLNANFLLSESRIFLDRLMACLNLTSQTKLGLFVVPISVNLHPALQILQTLNLSRPFSTLGSALSVSA